MMIKSQKIYVVCLFRRVVVSTAVGSMLVFTAVFLVLLWAWHRVLGKERRCNSLSLSFFIQRMGL